MGSRCLGCVLGLIAVLVLAAGATGASAASPVLEFSSPLGFPVGFTAEGGPVSAALSNFDTEVHCTGSRGEGTITGPHTARSSYVFTGCEAVGAEVNGAHCSSEGANEDEIRTPPIEAELVFIQQEKLEVGMLLAPDGDLYMSFECGGQSVEALGPFLSPVGPINHEDTSFTASLGRLGAVQFPVEYEAAPDARGLAVPTAIREGHEPGTTGVELSFAIHTGMPLTVRAISAAEVEARQRDEEAAAQRRHDDEEAAKAAAAARKHGEEEATKRRLEEEAAKRREEKRAKANARARQLSKALKQCRKSGSSRRRVRCEHRAKKRFGAHRPSKS